MTKQDEVKQVLVIRRDLQMRRGKEIAQGSHAAKWFLLERIKQAANGSWLTRCVDPIRPKIQEILNLSEEQLTWIMNDMSACVVLQAKDETELLEVHKLCREAGLEGILIQDAGLTAAGEGMKGIPTYTALGIGPDSVAKIDKITGPEGIHPLKLY